MRESSSVNGSTRHRLSFLTFVTMTNDPFARKRKMATLAACMRRRVNRNNDNGNEKKSQPVYKFADYFFTDY
jgi:hypothetical protein